VLLSWSFFLVTYRTNLKSNPTKKVCACCAAFYPPPYSTKHQLHCTVTSHFFLFYFFLFTSYPLQSTSTSLPCVRRIISIYSMKTSYSPVFSVNKKPPVWVFAFTLWPCNFHEKISTSPLTRVNTSTLTCHPHFSLHVRVFPAE